MSLNVQGFNKKNKFKIMLENILKIEGLSVLNKKEQESVNGGKSLNGGRGTCGYTTTFITYDFYGNAYETTITDYGVSKNDALSAVRNGGNWCCTSCGSASWL